MDHISCCLDVCASSLRGEETHGAIVAAGLETNTIIRQAPMLTITGTRRPLDEAAIDKLEKLLSILTRNSYCKSDYDILIFTNTKAYHAFAQGLITHSLIRYSIPHGTHSLFP